MKKIYLDKIYTSLVCLLIFLIPSNLFFKLDISSSYVNGLLVDYLIPKIYLSDIFIFLLLILWLIEVISKKKKLFLEPSQFYLPSILFSIFIIRQIFTPYPLASSWYLIKISTMLLLSLFLTNHKKIINNSAVFISIVITTLFQSGLSFWQFISQKSLLSYVLLGEPNLGNSIGLSKDMWWNTGRILPYATTAHPNILGGILSVFSLVLIKRIHSQSKLTKILAIIAVIFSLFTVILTQSISAMLTFILGLIFIKIRKINLNIFKLYGLIALLFIPLIINLAANNLTTNDSLIRRNYLQISAIKIIRDNPIMGIGLNQFTAKVEEYSPTKEIVRFVQPVHHIGLLWLAETGLLGVLTIFLIRKKAFLKKISLALVILIPIATLDHYLLTQQTGLLLLVFSTILFSQQS